MTNEMWKTVPGFPAYEVSDQGRVRSYYRAGREHGIAETPQRTLKPSIDGNGRLCVGLNRDGQRTHFKIASLVMWVFVGSCPDKQEVCHNDDDPTNNHLDNLRYDTHQSNMQDRTGGWWRHNRLSDEAVREIRRKRAAGATLTELAEEYNTSVPNLSFISTGQTHRHAGGPLTFGIAPGRRLGRNGKDGAESCQNQG